MADVSYWRNSSTGDVMRQEVLDDGLTTINPRPDSGATDATEAQWYAAVAQGEADIVSMRQFGLDLAAATADAQQKAYDALVAAGMDPSAALALVYGAVTA